MNKDLINTHQSPNSIKAICLQSLFAGVIGVIIAFVLVCITSIYLLINPLAVETVAWIAILSKYLCAIIAACIACAKRETKGYIRGVAGSVTFVLMGGVLFCSFSSGGFSGTVFLYDIMICSIIGVLAGAFTVNFNAKRKKHR